MNSSPDCVIGINPLQELLNHSPERISKVLVMKTDNLGDRKQNLLIDIQRQGIPIDFAKKDTLASYAGTDSHQGFVAILKKRVYTDLVSFLNKAPERTLILAIDSVYDPHNFGAILRSAECFGVGAILWSKNRGTDITPVVSKTSSGASEILPLIKVSNLASSLKQCKDKGFTLIAADMCEGAVNLEEFTYPDRSVLILGSEGEGIQPLVQSMCDVTVFIPMKGKITSLNVSQASAVLLSRWH